MAKRCWAMVAMAAVGTLGAAPAFPDTPVEPAGPGAKPGLPGWYRMGSASDPEGVVPLAKLMGKGELGTSAYGRSVLGPNARRPNSAGGFNGGSDDAAARSLNPPACVHQVVCGQDGTVLGGVSEGVERIVWRQTTGYSFAYPFDVPKGNGAIAAVSVDSRDNVWAFQRAPADQPALYKFGPDHTLLFAVAPALTDHGPPFRAHGMKVDGEDNVWICNEIGAVVQKFSPGGKLLQTIGVKGRRGDWNEAKGQRLLWEPVAIDFGPTGDIYIFEGHGDESPNDVQSDDPANVVGAARVVHLDRTGKFVNQWFGNDNGPGKFYNAHGGAVDPLTGDVWVGDRQDYRIVVFTANGRFLRTIAMRNLTSALFFDKRRGATFGQVWLGTGQDAQVLRIDRDGNVLGAIGSRKAYLVGDEFGQEPNHFGEASYMGIDSRGHLYVGDTLAPRVTELIPPAAPGKH